MENSVTKYLLYALGEIILVVVGILIALQINNWNENRKSNDQLENILTYISEDLKGDTLEIGLVLRNYEQRKPVFKRVLEDSATVEDYKTKLFYGSLVTSFVPMKIDERGYNLLKNYSSSIENQQDSLVTDIIQFYNSFLNLTEEFQGQVKDDVINNITDWKNTQDWFSSLMSGKLDDRFLNYVLTDPEYKNKVAYHQMMVYGNFLNFLKFFQQGADEILTAIQQRKEHAE